MIDETRNTADRREDLLTGVLTGVPGREIRTLKDTGWGELVLPAAAENPGKTAEGLRVLGICSATGGFLTFETLKLLERRLPGKVNIVGMVTDDPVDSRARITKKRRFWRYDTPEEQEKYEELSAKVKPIWDFRGGRETETDDAGCENGVCPVR